MRHSPPAPGNHFDQEANLEAAERVGTVLNDKWTLERLIGVGGMASVYAARHRNGARAAVKLLHPELSRHTEVRERFQREGYAANKVGHPGVVRVLDDDVIATGPVAGSAYLVMELLEGESMQDGLERGPPIGEREFLEIAECVLEVLQVAHARGVVHRDIKPENLFFAREGGETENPKTRGKVLGFGLARMQESQVITAYGLALGTPSFMSPEQAAGRLDEIDGRTDLFALAATGFRIRTGMRIHEADGPVELVTKMAQLPAPRIRTVARDVSEPYARVIDRALAFKRDDRHESAAAMRADIQRALSQISPAPQALSQEPPPHPAAPSDPTIELSERDIERPVPYGMDESIRIPKTHSIVPWLALLLVGGAGFAAWHQAPTEARLVALKWVGALKERVTWMLAPSPSGPARAESRDAPLPSDRMSADAGAPRMGLEAGGPRGGSSGPLPPWAAPPASSTPRPLP